MSKVSEDRIVLFFFFLTLLRVLKDMFILIIVCWWKGEKIQRVSAQIVSNSALSFVISSETRISSESREVSPWLRFRIPHKNEFAKSENSDG